MYIMGTGVYAQGVHIVLKTELQEKRKGRNSKMKGTNRKKLAGTARKGSRVVIAATIGAVMLGSTSYAEPGGIETSGTEALDIEALGIEDIFDEIYYADTYPELKFLYGYDRAALLNHFMTIGLYEGRTMNEMIDIVQYRERYPDLQAVFGDNWDAYVMHYLTCGAFEHRYNGTDFDPVDYLERYGDLKELLGNDVLAAYRHYEDCGKLEGREARSESVLKAQEESRRNAAESAKPAAAPAQSTSKPSESSSSSEPSKPTKPSEPAEPSEPTKPSEPSKPSEPTEPSNPSEPSQEAFEIQNVEVLGSGRIRVILNQKTEQPLEMSAFSIICNSGGSDMTILSVSTKDNMVYDLSTAYYKDQEYDIQITLADGTSISKVFAYRTDCAQLSSMNAVRTGADKATITYNSDEPGSFYYLIRENRMRAAEPTEDEIIRDGVKTEMKQHENTFTITGLAEGMSYTMYYVAVNTEDKATLVNSLSIEANVYEDTAVALKKAEAFEEKQENGYYLYGFVIELDSATAEPLTLDQFNVSCPQHETALETVKTSDNRTYRVYMKSGSVPKGNNTYTILIHLKDNTQLKGTCYLDLQAPGVTIREINWENENTVKVEVNSDEEGFLYYRIQDMVEGAGTTAPKDPAPIYDGGTKVSMGYGLNYITIENVSAGQWFCCASEDKRGNREGFYSYKQIQEYTGSPDEEQPSWPQIKDVEVLSSTRLKVVFDKSVDGLYKNTQTQISGLSGQLLIEMKNNSEWDVLDLTILNMSITEGSHTLSIVLDDGTKSTKLTHNFDFHP